MPQEHFENSCPKHQYKHCLYLHDSASYLRKQHISKISGGRLVSVLTLPQEVKALVLSLSNNDSVFQCVSVVVDGLTYAVDMAVGRSFMTVKEPT